MRIGFDISQTGSGKAGRGYFSRAMIQAMLELAPERAVRPTASLARNGACVP